MFILCYLTVKLYLIFLPLLLYLNTEMGCLSLLQWIFPIQESNQGLLHCRQILDQLSYEGIPCFGEVLGKCSFIVGASLLAQTVKNLPAIWET